MCFVVFVSFCFECDLPNESPLNQYIVGQGVGFACDTSLKAADIVQNQQSSTLTMCIVVDFDGR